MKALVSLPLYARLLAIALSHTILIVAIVLVFVPAHFDIGWSAFLSAKVRERLQCIGELIGESVGTSLDQAWDVDLQRFEHLYAVQFSVYDGSGRRIAGAEIEPSKQVLRELRQTTAIMDPLLSLHSTASGDATSRLPGWPLPDRDALKRWMFVMYGELESRYWVGIRTPVELNNGELLPVTVVASTDSLWHLIRLLDLRGWVDLVVCLLILSILVWSPFIWGLTRDVRKLITVADRIANGQFDSELRLRRRDEIGRLSHALAKATDRLNHFVESQKHFLANIAHEVNSPLGRLRLSLAILRDETETAESHSAFDDVEREMAIVADLVNELLAYSRVGIGDRTPPLSTVALYSLVLSVLDREKGAPGKVLISVPVDLQVQANPGLLARAVGNLVRNALRYAGTTNGAIEIVAEAQAHSKTASIRVLDRGPGVPELALLKLGDPFYQPEHARQRETGGIGLGLATVRNCVAACGGRVAFRNRENGGFEAEVVLPVASL